MMKQIHLYIMKHEQNNIVNCSTWNTYKRQEKRQDKRRERGIKRGLKRGKKECKIYTSIQL